MASIVVTYNTVDKTLSITEDGKEIPDVYRIMFEKYGEYASMAVECGTFDETNMMRRMLTIYAKEYINKTPEMDKFLEERIGIKKVSK